MPTIKVEFATQEAVKFKLDLEGQPDEGQFEVAGREMLAIAAVLRDARLAQQLAVPGGAADRLRRVDEATQALVAKYAAAK